jgi:uncharacterized protein (TIGR03067 family)
LWYKTAKGAAPAKDLFLGSLGDRRETVMRRIPDGVFFFGAAKRCTNNEVYMDTLKGAFLVVLSAVIVAATQGAAPNEPDAVKEGLKNLEGVWILKQYTTNGKDLPKEQLNTILGGQIEIKGDEMKMGKIVAKIVIDPSLKPKTIDRLVKGPGDRELMTPCIYELDGDTLKICKPAPLAKRDRPMEMKSGEGVVLEVYERKKN